MARTLALTGLVNPAGHLATAGHGVLAAVSNAPSDWMWGTIASVLFVAVVAVPAAVLNNRDRRRRRS